MIWLAMSGDTAIQSVPQNCPIAGEKRDVILSIYVRGAFDALSSPCILQGKDQPSQFGAVRRHT